MADLASLRIAVDSREVKSASADLANLGNTASRSEGSVNRLSTATRTLGGVFASIGIAAVVKQAITLADTYNRMSAQIALVTKSATDLANVEAQLFSMSQRTRVGYEATVELFTRMARSTQALGANQAAVARVTETINKALVVSGTSAAAASGSLMQLGQAFASGTLRGDELNSVMEGMPRVAKAIADGMGITVGELRKLGAQGKLTGAEVFNALLKMGDGIDKEFSKMPITVGQSFTVLNNSVIKFIGEIDNATGITAGLASAIVAVANNLDIVAVAAVAAAGAFAAVRAQMAISALTSYISSLVSLEMALGATSRTSALFSIALKAVQGSFRALTMTMMANPFVAVASAVAAIGVALYGMRDSQVKVGGETVRFGDIFLGIFQVIKNALGFVQRLFTEGWAAAFNYVSPALKNVGTFFGQVFGFIAKTAKSSINGIVGLFVGLGAAAKAIFTDQSVSGAFKAAFNKDYVGAFSDAIGQGILGLAKMGKATRDISITSEMATKPIGAVGTAAADAGKKAKEAADKLKGLQDFLKSLQDETAQIGMTPEQSKALEVEAKAAEAAALGYGKLAASIRGAGADWQAATATQKKADFVKNVIEPLENETRLLDKNTMARALANAELEMQRQGIERNSDAWNRYLSAVQANEEGKQKIEEQRKAAEEAKKAIEEFTNLKIDVDFDAVFGQFGKALGGVVTGIEGIVEATNAYKNALNAVGKDSNKLAAIESKNKRLMVNNYANLLGSAKGFFKEGSSGYKVLQAAETAYRAVSIALALKEMAIKVAGYGASASAATAGAAVEVAAATSVGAANAAAAIANQGKGDPFTAWARIAAMAVLMAGLGFAVMGGGKSKPPVTNTGTGTVFGDTEAQSKSVDNSIKRLVDINASTMRYSAQMLNSLKNIEAAMVGVTNLVLRTSGITNLASNVQTGNSANIGQRLGGTAAMAGAGAGLGFVVAGPVGAIVGSVIGGAMSLIKGLVSSLFGTKTSIVGQGITATAQSVADILATGFDVLYYTDIQKKKKFFGITTSTKYQTQTAAADAEINRQFSLVIQNIYDTVLATAGPLKLASDQVAKNMEDFVLNIGKIDVKGLTGEEIQERLTAVFGAAADNIAKAAIPGLEAFQKVGEGYFETIIRVASNIEVLDRAFQMLGQTTQNLTLQSQMALIDTFGDATTLMEQVNEYFNTFYTETEQVAAITKQLSEAMGLLGLTLPDTLSGFRALVEAQDLNTEAGRRTYAQLIQLSPAFADLINRMQELGMTEEVVADQTQVLKQRREMEITLMELQGDVAGALAARRQDELAAMDSSLHALQKQIWATQDAISVQQDAIRVENERTEHIKIRNAVEEEGRAARVSAADALRKAYDIESQALGNTIKQFSDLAETLREFSNSILPLAGNGPASIAQLNEQFMQTAMLARLGNTEAMAALPGIGGELRDAIIANATDRVSMMRQLAAMKFETDEALATADRQVSIAQNQLDAMTAQVSELITLNDNVLSLRDAILGVKKLNPRRPVSDFAIPSEYMTIRGGYEQRLADMFSGTGVDHYISANEAPSIAPYLPKGQYVMLPNGTIVPKGSSSHIAAIEAQSLDYEAYYGVSGFPRMIADMRAAKGYASGGIHSGGLRIVGENGPELEATGPSRIYNANQLSDMMNNRTTAEEVKSLRDELKLAMYQIAKNTGKSYDLLNRWDGDGLPPERIVA